jgi:ADP-ribose pyrophosphatase
MVNWQLAIGNEQWTMDNGQWAMGNGQWAIDNMPMQPWKVLARRTQLHQPKWLTVEFHDVELPNGAVINDWSWVITPDFVNVATVTGEGEFLCFRQNKYAVRGETLAPCGGYLEPGEDPLVAAQRELLEETGYSAPKWISLGSYAVDGNRGCGNAHLFLAIGARRVAEVNRDDLEEMHLITLAPEALRQALLAGQFKLVSWSQVHAQALLWLAAHT